MTFLLLLFIASGTTLIFLIIHKEVELAYGRGLIMKTVAHKTDMWLHEKVGAVRGYKSLVTKKNILSVSHFSLVYILKLTLGFFSKMRKKILKIIDKMEKKQVSLGEPGAASFYLKQITESKESDKRLTGK